MNRDGVATRINNPVLADADAFVERALRAFVSRCRTGRKNLDDERRGTPNIPLGQNVALVVGHHQQIRLHYVEEAEHAIEGSMAEHPSRVRLEEITQREDQTE